MNTRKLKVLLLAPMALAMSLAVTGCWDHHRDHDDDRDRWPDRERRDNDRHDEHRDNDRHDDGRGGR